MSVSAESEPNTICAMALLWSGNDLAPAASGTSSVQPIFAKQVDAWRRTSLVMDAKSDDVRAEVALASR